ncbi:MAG: hypothetical protein HON70_31715, partial [Lentisphaerae bacterium]|nr:hypothetical protein [Lentisphaerota bacterium]
RLLGGRVVTTFQPVADEAELALLDRSARGNVWKANLKTLGVTDLGQPNWSKRGAPPGLELFFDSNPMTLSRWPNEGFAKVVDTDGPVEKNRRGQDVSRTGRFVYEGTRPERWLQEKDGWVHGYWFHDWSDQRHPIAGIDTAKHVISVRPPLHHYGYRKGKWFYAFNLLREIDSPGEWYLNRETGLLYFWPPHTDWKRARPSISMIDTLVSIKDAAYITLRGIVLESCRGTAATISGGTHNRIAGCTIRNTGAKGIEVRGGTSNGVLGCDITDTGLGGVHLNGGERKTLTRADLYAVNNHIWHYGRWQRMYTPAVGVHGVGNRVANNLMHDAPHQAVGFSGNDHIIELNEIHSVCHESNDAGAIYGGCNWSFRGTHIRNNYMHHIEGFRGRGCVGVYLDDILSGHHIDGNVFHKVTRAAFIGGGSDCTIDNNVFVDCKPALHVDARGMGKYDYGASSMQPKRLKQMPYQESPWKEHYPRLVGMLEDDPHIPKYNRITRNISVGGRWDNEVNPHARKHGIIENNLVNEDPLFVNPAALDPEAVLRPGDFGIQTGSPAWKRGFKALPLAKMGLYRDEFRASWPVEHSPLPTQRKTPVKRTTPKHVAWSVKPGTIVIDGKSDEWPCVPEAAIRCAESAGGTASKLISTAWAAFDGTALYLLVRNPIDSVRPLVTDGAWGTIDAVEFALRNPVQSKSMCYTNAIYNPRGFPDGRQDSVVDAGASEEQAKALNEAMDFAATRTKDHWTGEWCIPLKAIGIAAAKTTQIPFNLNIRRMADNSWMVWTRTGGPIWAVDDAGLIVLRSGE